MDELTTLLAPTDCALLLIDQQAGLAFGVGSVDRQVLLGNTIALARTAKVVWTSGGRHELGSQGLQRSTHADSARRVACCFSYRSAKHERLGG